MDSLFAPLGPLSPHLEPYRFWIWLQMVALRLYVRALKGRGVPFMTVIDHRGTVCDLMRANQAARCRSAKATPCPVRTPDRATFHENSNSPEAPSQASHLLARPAYMLSALVMCWKNSSLLLVRG